jgi:hypothetical protein
MIICSAFQSTYILDDSTRLAYYSYAWKLDPASRQKYIEGLTTPKDSLDSIAVGGTRDWETYYTHVEAIIPTPYEVRRSSYGIIKYEPMWLKNYKMKDAPMENVLAPPVEKESTSEDSVDIGDFVASDFGLDSLQADSSELIVAIDSIETDSLLNEADLFAQEPKKPREPKYLYGYDPNGPNNMDQDYYNKYFGELLLDRRPDPVEDTPDSLQQNTEVLPDSLQNEKKGLFGGSRRDRNKPEEEMAPTDSLGTLPNEG